MKSLHSVPRVAVAMLGARRHYAVPRLLHEAGFLEQFFTDSYVGNKPWLEVLLSAIPEMVRPGGVQRLLMRKDIALPPEKVISFDMLGVWYVHALKAAKKTGNLEAVFCEAALRFSQRICKHGLGDSDVVWGFNGASLELFEYAKGRQIFCILDQTSNPNLIEERLTKTEHLRWQDWLPSISTASSTPMLRAREYEEWRLADMIVTGSNFVKMGLVECGVSKEKIRVIPSGLDLARFAAQPRSVLDRSRPLRLLFVGRVSIMKGVPYLMQALAKLGPNRVEVKLIGDVLVDPNRLASCNQFLSALGVVPRSKVLEYYSWADVFCLPSITEGSAAVTYEALAMGVPVITTPNAGSVVKDGVDGFIVPACDSDALADAIACYADNPLLLAKHQSAAISNRAKVGLGRYRSDIVQLINDIFSL